MFESQYSGLILMLYFVTPLVSSSVASNLYDSLLIMNWKGSGRKHSLRNGHHGVYLKWLRITKRN
jgi:hypothetical protein